MIAFLLYDFVITFGREVKLFWTRRFSGASFLFFANRYISLTFNVLSLVQFGNFNDQVCTHIVRVVPCSYCFALLGVRLAVCGAAFTLN